MLNPLKKLFAATATEKKPDTTPMSLIQQTAVDQLLEMMGQYHDPDQLLQELGKTRSDLRKMLGDDEISAALETRLNAVQNTGWHLENSDSPQQITDFVNEQLKTHLDNMITTAWAAVPFGYSVIEVVYCQSGRQYTWDRIANPPFEWFRPQQDGSLKFYPHYGDTSGYGETVDSFYKFHLTQRLPSVTNPNGEALLARLWWPWFFRTNGWDFWAKFLERHGSPILLGKTVGNQQDMAVALQSAVQSAVIAVGRDDDVQISGTTNNGESFKAFHAATDKRIQKVILGQTLTSDVGDTGSYAAAKVHNEVRQDRKLADCQLVGKTINHMIEALVALNFPNAVAPVFVMEDSKGLEQGRAERDKTLTDANMVSFSKNYIINNYDLEEKDFDLPAAPSVADNGSSFSNTFKLASGQEQSFTPAQQALEDLADDSLNSIAQPISQDDLKTAINAATDPDDLVNRLALLIDTGDTQQFNRTMERALYAADIMGYAAAQEQEQ